MGRVDLDIGHPLQLLQLVRRSGVTTLAALHDLNLAAMFCDTIGPARGRIVAAGPQLSVLAPTLLAEVYGVDVDVTVQDGRPVITYRRPS